MFLKIICLILTTTFIWKMMYSDANPLVKIMAVVFTVVTVRLVILQ